MNARNDFKRLSDRSLELGLVLAAVQLRLAARVDFLVARWLERCATNIETAQGFFESDRTMRREFGSGFTGLVG